MRTLYLKPNINFIFKVVAEFAKGWSQRNFALQYIRWRYNNDSTNNAVVYFADDDNSYGFHFVI